MVETRENKNRGEMIELGWGEKELERWKWKFKRNDTEGREGEKRRGKGSKEKGYEGNKKREKGVEEWNVLFWNVDWETRTKVFGRD